MGKQQSVGAGGTTLRTVRGGRAILALLMSGLVLWWALPVNAGTGITISTTLDAGACTASLPSSTLTLGPEGKIDPSPALGKAWVFLAQGALEVNVVCSGLSPTTLRPALKITPKSDTVEILNQPGLFASTSTGFGVAIGNIPDETSLKEGQLVTASNPHVNLGNQGDTPAALQYSLPVAVACGGTDGCAPANLKAGAVSATFIVNFEYH